MGFMLRNCSAINGGKAIASGDTGPAPNGDAAPNPSGEPAPIPKGDAEPIPKGEPEPIEGMGDPELNGFAGRFPPINPVGLVGSPFIAGSGDESDDAGAFGICGEAFSPGRFDAGGMGGPAS